MSVPIEDTVMWIVVAWPLLLAIPVIHKHLRWPCHLAIIPAVILALMPGDATLELPWLQFGTVFAIDEKVRWLLVMCAAIWLMAATVRKPSMSSPGNDRTTTIFLLTLTGNLGAVLAADLVSFFSFSTLMGYGFYALLVQGGNKEVRRAAHFYLIFLIIADLALFEALLLAASTTEDLRYAVVRQVITDTESWQFYYWMAFVAFMLKAGIWPFHLWLPAAFNSVHVSKSLLLAGVPVAIGLVGITRWLPLGEPGLQGPWHIIQILGIIAIMYAALRFFTHASMQMLPAWITVAASGVVIMTFGTGLAQADIWNQYKHIIYPFIALLGISVAVLTFHVNRLPIKRQRPDVIGQRIETFALWTWRRISVLQRWIEGGVAGFMSFWRALRTKLGIQFQRILASLKPRTIMIGWSAAITIFVILGLTLALI